uniref:Placental growth factor n=1 Tax=Pseudonaja textilis TaxID=8673 RepID=A0A670Y9M6_PSETE
WRTSCLIPCIVQESIAIVFPAVLYFHTSFRFLVVSFFDVWNRSSCQPLEKLVSVVSEYPHEVEHVFKPSCVSVRRCCGCCRDEALQCVPVEMANITMEVGEKTVVPFILEHRYSFYFNYMCVCLYKIAYQLRSGTATLSLRAAVLKEEDI